MTPFPRSRRWNGFVLVLAIGLPVFIAALGLDGWCWKSFGGAGLGSDLTAMLRVPGYLPFWLLVALVLAIAARGRPGAAGHPAGARLVAGSAILGVVAAEVGKWLVRRERPGDLDPGYVFRSFTAQPWSTSDLGFPSSHATVAFAAFVALSLAYPRARALFLGLATATALSRVRHHAHYLSDVAAGAVVGSIVAFGVAALVSRRPDAARAAPGAVLLRD